MPARSVVYSWIAEKRADFPDRYARAREAQAFHLADELLDIADAADEDWTVDAAGHTRVNHEHIQRSKLRVDTRKWMLSKLLPKVYGDKLQVGGDSDSPVEIQVTRKVVKAGPPNRVAAKKNGARR